MQTRIQPTTKQNVAARLFFRYFLCYFACVLLFGVLSTRLVPAVSRTEVGSVQLLLALLALLGGFLTISKPYLLLLCMGKALYDVCAFRMLMADFSIHGGGALLAFNALVLYGIFSLLLFCLCAARASLFSFDCTARDFTLILSRPCLRFLGEAVFLAALSLSLYYLWPQLSAML